MSTDHPDLWLVRQIHKGADAGYLAQLQRGLPDSEETARAAIEEIADGLIDPEALIVGAQERATAWMAQIPPMALLAIPASVLASVYSDAFVAGLRFAHLGGHINPESSKEES